MIDTQTPERLIPSRAPFAPPALLPKGCVREAWTSCLAGVRTGRSFWWAFALLCMSFPLVAQQSEPSMGALAARDAHVSGGLEVLGDKVRLLTNANVTALDHDAPVALNRGGHVMVCSTSEFHLLRSGAAGALIFGLDRGAFELVTDTRPQDLLLTPDLRFIPVTQGSLDLRLRVTPEGDTCVDNAGAGAPVLAVNDPFSAATYRILPGQHLLFVKGDLHRVVDHERTSCGCPVTHPPQRLAGKPGQPTSPTAAAAAHPFPEAQGAGLAPTIAAANSAPTAETGSEVSTTFNYGDGQTSAADDSKGAPSPAPATPPTAPEQSGFLHAIGRFFHRLFRSS